MPRGVAALTRRVVPALGILVSLPGMPPSARPAAAQTMPGGTYARLVSTGHERLARQISRQLHLRSSPNAGDVERLLARWEREADGPRTGLDWLTVSRLWLRAGDAPRAAKALRRARDRVSPGLHLLESARIAFLAGDPEGAELYWEACQAADEESAREAWLDVEPLATPEELAEWDRLRRLPAGQRDDCGLLRRLWNLRVAASGLDRDERVAAHYGRLRYALHHYRRRGKEGPVFAAELGRPRNAVFDDRGLLYVRVGPPDETASAGGDECIEPNVTWAYDAPGGYRLYHLSPLGGTDDWWLLRNLAQVYRCGAQVGNPFTSVPLLASAIPPDAISDLYLSRQLLDPRYATIAYRALSGRDDLSRLRTLQSLAEEAEWTWADAERLVRGVPEQPAVALDVRLALEWLQFRAPRPGATLVWLNGLLETDALRPVESRGEGLRYRVAVVWTLVDESGDFYQRIPAEFEVDRAPGVPEDAGLSVRLAAELPPGSYRAMLAVSDRNSEPSRDRPSGNYVTDTLSVRDMGGDLPLVSDVAVAADSGGPWTPGGGIYMGPSLAHETGPDGIAYIYYETYNLTPGGPYVTHVHLEPEGDGDPFDLSYPGRAARGGQVVTRGFLRLDLKDSRPGTYRMTVTVRDLTTGFQAMPIRASILVDRDLQPRDSGVSG